MEMHGQELKKEAPGASTHQGRGSPTRHREWESPASSSPLHAVQLLQPHHSYFFRLQAPRNRPTCTT